MRRSTHDRPRRRNPCPECPFSKTVQPGALGGSPISTYIGQAHGPFVLPCHKHCDFSNPGWKDDVMNTPQCAGAAMYRANVGVSGQMPAGIGRLGPSHLAFSTPAEFMAHHLGVAIPEEDQAFINSEAFTNHLVQLQLMRPSNKLHHLPADDTEGGEV